MDGLNSETMPLSIAISQLKNEIVASIANMQEKGMPAYVIEGVLDGILLDVVKVRSKELENDYAQIIKGLQDNNENQDN